MIAAATATVSTFPTCELHSVRIVQQFPAECPLASRDVQSAVLRLRDRMFWDGESDPHPAVAIGKVYDLCTKCIGGALRNPHIRFLREGLSE